MSDYVLQVGRRRLRLGTTLEPSRTATAMSAVDASWDLPRQPLTAREIVESLDTLFEAVCLRLGPAVDREPLLQSMAATLAIAGREACLPLAALAFADPVRRELTSQAARIGRTLAAWAAEANRAGVALGHVGRERLETLELRSRCDGHLWTEKATSILTGGRGGPVVMQLLQRVASPDGVAARRAPALRELGAGAAAARSPRRLSRPARPRAGARQVPRRIPHADSPPCVGRGFCPVALRARWHTRHRTRRRPLRLPGRKRPRPADGRRPGRYRRRSRRPADVASGPVASPPTGRTLAFRHAFADYLAAPRSPIGPPSDDVDLLDEAAIVAEPADEDSVRLRLELTTDRTFLSGGSRTVSARPALRLQARPSTPRMQPRRLQHRTTWSATISVPCSVNPAW